MASLLFSPGAALAEEGLMWGGVESAEVKGEQDAPAPAPRRSPLFPVPVRFRLSPQLRAPCRGPGLTVQDSRAAAAAGDPVTCDGRPALPRPAGSAGFCAGVPNSWAATKVLLSYFQSKLV